MMMASHNLPQERSKRKLSLLMNASSSNRGCTLRLIFILVIVATALKTTSRSFWEQPPQTHHTTAASRTAASRTTRNAGNNNVTIALRYSSANPIQSNAASRPTPQPSTTTPKNNQPTRRREPWHVLDEYISWHSRHAMETFSSNQASSFAVGVYSCPHQLGNRMHHFLNSFLWSILTNRTLVAKYYTRETCLAPKFGGNHFDQRICQNANTAQDCAKYLQLRTDWILSLEEDHLENNNMNSNFPFDVKHWTRLSFWTTHSQSTPPGRGVLPFASASSQKELRDQRPIDLPLYKIRYPVVVFPPMLGQSSALTRPDMRHELLSTAYARQTAQTLYQYGADFLYGLLWEAAFGTYDPDPAAGVEGNYHNTSAEPVGGFTNELYQHTTAQIVLNNRNHHNRTQTTDNFTMDDDTDVDDEDNEDVSFSRTCSIAVHSRHVNWSAGFGNDTSIQPEVDCIQQLWKHFYLQQQQEFDTKNTSTTTTNGETVAVECDLFVMTDRPNTLQALIQWCQEQMPSASIAPSQKRQQQHDNINPNANTTAQVDDQNMPLFPCRRVVHASHQKGFSFVAEHGYVRTLQCIVLQGTGSMFVLTSCPTVL